MKAFVWNPNHSVQYNTQSQCTVHLNYIFLSSNFNSSSKRLSEEIGPNLRKDDSSDITLAIYHELFIYALAPPTKFSCHLNNAFLNQQIVGRESYFYAYCVLSFIWKCDTSFIDKIIFLTNYVLYERHDWRKYREIVLKGGF